LLGTGEIDHALVFAYPSRNVRKPNISGSGIFRLSKYSILTLFALATLLPLQAQVEGLVTTGLYSQYLWRGRDYTLAGAPVATTQPRAQAYSPVGNGLVVHADILTLNAIARPDAPWEAASADAIRLSNGVESAFFECGWLGVEIAHRSPGRTAR